MIGVKVSIPQDQIGIAVAGKSLSFDECLIEVTNGTSSILAQNPTDDPLIIERNEDIGSFEITQQSQISSITAETDLKPPCCRCRPKQVDRITASLGKNRDPSKHAKLMHDLDLSKVPVDLHCSYRQIISSYSDVFSIDPNDIGHCTVMNQKIRLIDPNRVSCIPPYRLPHNLKPVAEHYVRNLLASKVLKHSTSPFSSPLMLVRKLNSLPSQPLVEQYRVVHDYRHLNQNTIKDLSLIHI